MLLRGALTAFALLLLPPPHSLAQSLTDAAAKTADQTQPLATVQTFIKANTSGDLDLIVSTFAEDATVFFPSDPPERVSGRARIREAFAVLLKRRSAGAGPVIKPTDVDVQVMGNTAIVTAHLDRPSTAAPGTSRRSFVLRREGERWLIVHHHASNLQAAVR